jgi:hypothetical protein
LKPYRLSFDPCPEDEALPQAQILKTLIKSLGCASSLNPIAPPPTAYSGKEKAATATRAFWLPFAYRHSGDYSEVELRDLAQQSIWQMEAQIQHLREEFDLGMARSGSTELVGTPDAENLQAESGSSLVQPVIVVAPAADLLNEFTDAL